MIRRPPRSTLFPYRRSSDLCNHAHHLLSSFGFRPRAVGSLREGRRMPETARPAPPRFFRWMVLIFVRDRKSTRLNSSHLVISYAVFCLKKKKTHMSSSMLYI